MLDREPAHESAASPERRVRRQRDRRPGARYEAAAEGPAGVLGRSGTRAHPLGEALHRGARLVQPAVRPLVRRRHAQRRLQLPRPPRRGRQRRPGRVPLGGRARRHPHGHLRRAHRGGEARRERARCARRQAGRPRRHLHAAHPGGGHRDARGRPAGCRALGRVRRVQRGVSAQPHRRRPGEGRHHRRRRVAQGQGLPAQADRGCGARRWRRIDRARARRPPRRERDRLDRRPRPLVARRAGQGGRRARGRGVRGREPAVHPLHLRHHREAQGHPAHQRRLPDAGRVHAQERVRPAPRDRRVLVHGGRRLGHRPQLRRLRRRSRTARPACSTRAPPTPRTPAAGGSSSRSTA